MNQTEEFLQTPNPTEKFECFEWEVNQARNVWECRFLICPKDDGRYSALALKLPGVESEGNTPEEAAERIAAAFREAITVYHENGHAIPWQQELAIERPKGAIEKWIVVAIPSLEQKQYEGPDELYASDFLSDADVRAMQELERAGQPAHRGRILPPRQR